MEARAYVCTTIYAHVRSSWEQSEQPFRQEIDILGFVFAKDEHRVDNDENLTKIKIS